MKNQWLTIHQLDRQLKEWQAIHNKYRKPKTGWVKMIRTALSMSAEQLATRLGVTRGRITQLESAEIQSAVTLRTLEEVANALDCELVYAIVPNGKLTLEDIIKARANQVAKEQIARVAHTMSLEAQSVDTNNLEVQKNELTEKLIKHLNKKLWSEPDKLKNKTDSRKKLINHLLKKK